jgi:hypothetical protein
MSDVVRHSLKNRDEKTLTADCSVCGFVAIRKSGNGFQCATKIAERHKAWTKRNPQKAAANRRLKSKHELSSHDYPALTAWCSECEVFVDLVIWGAGYACGVNARALRTVQQESLVGNRCRECAIIDGPAGAPRLDASGNCPRCAEGPNRYDSRHVPVERRDHGGDLAALYKEWEAGGFLFEDANVDPDFAEPNESAVPGWKTLGSRRPWNEV